MTHGAEVLIAEREAPCGGSLLDRVQAGAVVRLPGAAQRAALLEPLRHAVQASIAPTNRGVATALDTRGLESLHEFFDVEGARRAVVDMRPALNALAIPTVRGLFSALSAPRRLFICTRLSPRVHVPLDDTGASGAQVDRAEAHRVLGLGPHRDSSLGHPRGAVILWIAVTRVQPGNSLLLYPDAWGRAVPEAGRIGDPVAFELGLGDVLAFSVDHLHATRPNHTRQTRVSVSARFVPDRLRYNRSHLWQPYVDARLLHTRLESLATLRSRCSFSYVNARWLLARRRYRDAKRAADVPGG